MASFWALISFLYFPRFFFDPGWKLAGWVSWQNRHEAPFMQMSWLKNAHGLQEPKACPAEPRDGGLPEPLDEE